MKRKLVSVGILVFWFLLAGCDNAGAGGTGGTGSNGGSGGGAGGNNLSNRIGVKFVASTSANRSITDQTEEISGMLFGQLEIKAYQYLPGYINKSSFVYANEGPYDGYDESGPYVHPKNWVVYNIMLQSPLYFILPSSGEFDISEYFYPFLAHTPTEDSFSVDFFTITFWGTGVVFNNILYANTDGGANNSDFMDNMRLKQPGLVSNLRTPTFIEGFQHGLLHYYSAANDFFQVIFARSDWFPEPVYVYLYPVSDDIPWSTKPLTEHQINILRSCLKDSYLMAYNKIIIPYDGPLKIALKSGAEGMKNPEFKISFDYKQLLTDETYNNLVNGAVFMSTTFSYEEGFKYYDGEKITYRTVNNLPFGLSVSINEMQ